MDLTTKYLGFTLPHPLMPGASPLVDDLDLVRRLEDAGAAAIVMHSLFEEQLTREQLFHHAAREDMDGSFAEATSYLPEPAEYRLGPDEYLHQISRIKSMVQIPVFASLNGTTDGGWLRHARLIAQAGADGLELNMYFIPTDDSESSWSIEQRMLLMVEQVLAEVQIPVAVKLSPYFTALPHLAKRLSELGVAGLVMFNRFYQPDIDPERLELTRTNPSDPGELLLRLRWLAILHGRYDLSLAASGGVHSGVDVIKAIMAGADAVQVVSALLRHGPERLATLRESMEHWLEDHEYQSLAQAKGSMSHANCPDPQGYERANYVKILQTWPT